MPIHLTELVFFSALRVRQDCIKDGCRLIGGARLSRLTGSHRKASAYEGGDESMATTASREPRRGRDDCHCRTAAGRQAGERPNMRSAAGAWPRET